MSANRWVEIDEIRVNFPLGTPRWFRHLKYFEKALALKRIFDIFSAPFRPEGKSSLRRSAASAPQGGWSAWLQADN
jgi:hypothetical protein